MSQYSLVKLVIKIPKKKMRLGQNHPLKLKKDWNLSFFSNSSPFTSRKIKLQLYAAYIFLNLLPSKPNPFLFLL